ncbi:hypothetical protein KY284_030024 [Solanum tuberosum]|nr:hypothetical protein KY284_030024 [Solanum tuberosum]
MKLIGKQLCFHGEGSVAGKIVMSVANMWSDIGKLHDNSTPIVSQFAADCRRAVADAPLIQGPAKWLAG